MSRSRSAGTGCLRRRGPARRPAGHRGRCPRRRRSRARCRRTRRAMAVPPIRAKPSVTCSSPVAWARPAAGSRSMREATTVPLAPEAADGQPVADGSVAASGYHSPRSVTGAPVQLHRRAHDRDPALRAGRRPPPPRPAAGSGRPCGRPARRRPDLATARLPTAGRGRVPSRPPAATPGRYLDMQAVQRDAAKPVIVPNMPGPEAALRPAACPCRRCRRRSGPSCRRAAPASAGAGGGRAGTGRQERGPPAHDRSHVWSAPGRVDVLADPGSLAVEIDPEAEALGGLRIIPVTDLQRQRLGVEVRQAPGGQLTGRALQRVDRCRTQAVVVDGPLQVGRLAACASRFSVAAAAWSCRLLSKKSKMAGLVVARHEGVDQQGDPVVCLV